MTLVYEAPSRNIPASHKCDPPMNDHDAAYPDDSIWMCGCGRFWYVAYHGYGSTGWDRVRWYHRRARRRIREWRNVSHFRGCGGNLSPDSVAALRSLVGAE